MFTPLLEKNKNKRHHRGIVCKSPNAYCIMFIPSKVFLFKLRNRCGFLNSHSILGVQPPADTISGSVGASDALRKCTGLGGSGPALPAVLGREWLLVELLLVLKVVSVGLESGCQGPPKRRTILASSLSRQRRFCSDEANAVIEFADLAMSTEKRSDKMELRTDLSAVFGRMYELRPELL